MNQNDETVEKVERESCNLENGRVGDTGGLLPEIKF